ncbi:hydrogen peroxide-inducible genes activator [Magnetospira sp. QH-2]|uniref:hydrogen peroxide-inducible genes activator n=1 Tax=Magnetospira sp. (strain QH-2) TaxID=1288970 RepID=UPI0003E8147A|nr:hydrogen peroxide-inducible genes activator [Magnetospira sp. QH-2]CCQ72205.1 Hydrogen peroxide-inducible genes activator protein [Magnetospira sp. QH-2]
MPTLRQLSYLVAVADECHFGRAAQRVHVTQPTLSIQFAALESKLGVRLIERSRAGVYLTPLGRQVTEKARAVLADVQDIVDLTTASANEFAGNLRLGVPPTLGPYLLPHVIPEMHRRFPALKLYVREGTPRHIQEDLAAGDLDLVLTPAPVAHQGLDIRVLFEEAIFVVGAPDHELALADGITLADLKGHKVLTLESGHHLHTQVRELCAAYDAELLYEFEGTSLDTLRHMVGMNVGLSFFPELYIRSEMPTESEVKVLPLEDAALSREICMAWRSRSGLEPHYQAIADLVKLTCQTLFLSRRDSAER